MGLEKNVFTRRNCQPFYKKSHFFFLSFFSFSKAPSIYAQLGKTWTSCLMSAVSIQYMHLVNSESKSRNPPVQEKTSSCFVAGETGAFKRCREGMNEVEENRGIFLPSRRSNDLHWYELIHLLIGCYMCLHVKPSTVHNALKNLLSNFHCSKMSVQVQQLYLLFVAIIFFFSLIKCKETTTANHTTQHTTLTTLPEW